MPMTALFGLTDDPSELLGYGPITAGMARELAASATWRRLLFDPESGALLDHGRTTYTPPVALADFVKARDVYCRFPGCRRKVVNGELDHLCAYAEGGADQRDQPGRVLRPPPPPQTRRRRLAGPSPARRWAGVDQPDRAPARHPALRLPQRPRPTLSSILGPMTVRRFAWVTAVVPSGRRHGRRSSGTSWPRWRHSCTRAAPRRRSRPTRCSPRCPAPDPAHRRRPRDHEQVDLPRGAC